MIDTRDALELGALPEGVENGDYVNSWRAGSSAPRGQLPDRATCRAKLT